MHLVVLIGLWGKCQFSVYLSYVSYIHSPYCHTHNFRMNWSHRYCYYCYDACASSFEYISFSYWTFLES